VTKNKKKEKKMEQNNEYLVKGFAALQPPKSRRQYFKFSPVGVRCRGRLVDVLGTREEPGYQGVGMVNKLDFTLEVHSEGVDRSDNFTLKELPEPTIMKVSPRSYWCRGFMSAMQDAAKALLGWDGQLRNWDPKWERRVCDEVLFEFTREEIKTINGKVGGNISMKHIGLLEETDVPF
tara:strand:- start:944 stop:1477 length:534 start_codon:yes stop_codon:yes gene_type:complete